MIATAKSLIAQFMKESDARVLECGFNQNNFKNTCRLRPIGRNHVSLSADTTKWVIRPN